MKKPSGRREFIARRLLFVADHSSNLIPPDLGDLGLDPGLLEDHIAVDVGVDPLTRTLRDRMGARAYFGSVSRLVLDVNREPDHPGLIPDSSDGILIPGNQDLSDAEVQRRVLKYHHEYHDGLAAEIDTIETKSRGAILVSIHSFTPRLREKPTLQRPWHIGLLYNRDARLATKALEWFGKNTSLTIGDNEPYSGKALNYTMDRHAEARGLPYLTLEFRQDLINTPEGVASFAALTQAMLMDIL